MKVGDTHKKEGSLIIERHEQGRNSRFRRMIGVDFEMRSQRFGKSLNPLLLIGSKACPQNWGKSLAVLCWSAAIFNYALKKLVQ